MTPTAGQPADRGAARAFAIVACGLGLLYLLPLWLFEFPRMLDFPAHLAMADQLREALFHAASSDWELRGLPWPNVLFATLTGALQPLLGSIVAGKLVLSAALLGTVAAIVLYLRRLGLHPWGALLGFPVLFNLPVRMGICSFLVALPLLIVTVALAPRTTTLRRVAALALLAALTFCAHAALFMALGPTLVAHALFSARERRRTTFAVCVAYAVPAALLLCVWAHSVADLSWHREADSAAPLELLFPLQRASQLLDWVSWLLPRWEYLALLAVFFISLGALLLRPVERRAWRCLAPAGAVMAVAAVLPTAVGEAALMGVRTLYVAVLLLLPLLPLGHVTPSGRRHLAVLIVAIMAHAATTYALGGAFDRRMRAAQALARAVPVGSSLLGDLETGRRGAKMSALRPFIFQHLPSYLYAWRRVRSNLLPSAFSTTVVRAKAGRLARPLLDTEFTRAVGQHGSAAREIPFLLLVSARRPSALRWDFEPVLRSTYFTLYRNLGHEQASVRLPAVADACRIERHGEGARARCDHELRWIDAARSCRDWGGVLSQRAAAAERREWVGCSSRGHPGRVAWLHGGLQRGALPIGDSVGSCAVVDARVGGWRPRPCGARARVICQRAGRGPLAVERDSRRFAIGDTAYLVYAEPMTFATARAACARQGAKLLLPDPTIHVPVSLSDAFWVGVRRADGWGRWQAVNDRRALPPLPWSRQLLQLDRELGLCCARRAGLSLERCAQLLPFSCERASEERR